MVTQRDAVLPGTIDSGVTPGRTDCLATGTPVLIVDDNCSAARVLAEGFLALGCQPWLAMTVEHALTTVSVVRPLLVVTELKLGGAPIYDMISCVRQELASARIVLSSRYARLEHAWHALRVGADYCIAQPASAFDIMCGALSAPPPAFGIGGRNSQQPCALQNISWQYIESIWEDAPSLSEAARLLGVDRRWLQRVLRRKTVDAGLPAELKSG